jgi:23S rRNA (uracil1939-C5)-methyltransferase
VLAPALQAGLTCIREQLAPLLAGEGELMLGTGADGRCVAELLALRPQPPAVYTAAAALVEQGALAGFSLRAGGADLAPALFGDPRQVGRGPDGSPLWAEAAGFTQVNPALNELLMARVLSLAEPRAARVLELFAGHGNFTIGLAAEADELVAIEADRKAADACRDNLRARGLTRARVVCSDAASIPGRGVFDVVVLDPPRSGARAALPALLARKPRRIVYVSCDLASLRRDLGELLAAGYRADAAGGFDMFPQTSHMEAVVRLVRDP